MSELIKIHHHISQLTHSIFTSLINFICTAIIYRWKPSSFGNFSLPKVCKKFILCRYWCWKGYKERRKKKADFVALHFSQFSSSSRIFMAFAVVLFNIFCCSHIALIFRMSSCLNSIKRASCNHQQFLISWTSIFCLQFPHRLDLNLARWDENSQKCQVAISSECHEILQQFYGSRMRKIQSFTKQKKMFIFGEFFTKLDWRNLRLFSHVQCQLFAHKIIRKINSKWFWLQHLPYGRTSDQHRNTFFASLNIFLLPRTENFSHSNFLLTFHTKFAL